MTTSPYLHFQGQCADALAFYAAVFGATDMQIMRYGEGPGAPPHWAGSARVMHGQITMGVGTLMASDYPPGIAGDPQTGFSVMQSVADATIAQQVFDRLAEGGTIVDPMKPTFFSPAFGMVRDRFGTAWIISAMPDGDAAPGAAPPH